MSKAYVFPGQGSQSIGMGKEFYKAFSTAREVFEEVDEALSQHLSNIIFEGAESDLNLTVNTQPALMAVSLAIFRVMEKELGLDLTQAYCFAGHSLGEYSALAAAGVISLTDTARLLRVRGQAMQDAVPVGIGAMAAVIGLEHDVVTAIVKQVAQNQVCAVANDNSPGQVVISGHTEAVDQAIVLAEAKGARKCVKLSVSAPFHCSLMQPAAVVMAEALSQIKLSAPTLKILINVTADYEDRPTIIRDNLVEQVTGQVRWRESIARLPGEGVTEIIEIGAGKVLTGLNKRIAPDIKTYAINTPDDIEASIA